MSFFKNDLLMEVEELGTINRVEMCIGDNRIYEPQCSIHLKEPGKCSLHRFVGTLIGDMALFPFKKGDLVKVKPIFWKYKENGKWINQILINNIKLVNNLKEFDYE